MKIVWQRIATLIIFTFSAFFVQAQFTVIELANPSFEDIPRHSHTPQGWRNCGFQGESAPDIQPDFTFRVSKRAVEGSTYLGMVVRDNDTWESVGQLLSKRMEKGTCYEFSIKLARSLSYLSVSRELNQPANYITPTKLRIWGGYGMCDKRFLLGESYLVRHEEWKMYEFKFEPDASYTHIILEAFYQTPTLFPYNGNLLLDDASFLKLIPCDTDIPEGPQDYLLEDPIVLVDPIDDPVITPVIPPNIITPKGTDEEEVTISGVKRSEMTSGKTIRLENLQFETDEARITSSSLPALRGLYEFMAANTDINIEVGGHTSGLAAKEYALSLSTARAKSIVEYLTIKGIAPERVQHKGYGKEKPIDTNDTPEGRSNNQRVEVKIL